MTIPLEAVILIYAWSFIQFYMRCSQLQELYELRQERLYRERKDRERRTRERADERLCSLDAEIMARIEAGR